MKKRMIRVQGRARVTAAPDTVTISFTIEGKAYDYSETIDALNKRVAALRASMASVGVEKNRLKTTDFKVTPEYIYGEDNARIFVGFKAIHNIVVDLPWEQTLLNRAVNALGRCESKAQFRIDFTVTDDEEANEKALAKAVSDARRKAETLARAGGVELGEIVEIQHGWIDIRVSSQMNYDMAPGGYEAPDIDPEDIEMEESVTIVWRIAE